MPVQYPAGIIAEHLHTPRPGRFCSTCRVWARFGCLGGGRGERWRRWCRASCQSSDAGAGMRYSLLLNPAGGILDDLMATRTDDGLMLVVNAACKEKGDLAHLKAATRIRRS